MLWDYFFADPVSMLPHTDSLMVGFRVGKFLLECRFLHDPWCWLVLTQIEKLRSQIFFLCDLSARIDYTLNRLHC